MQGTCIVCNQPFQRGAGQSRSKYCSTECRRAGRKPTAKKTAKPTNGTRPQPFQKTDGYWYCTYEGRQHYLGSDLLRANTKLEQLLNGTVPTKSKGGPLLKEVIEDYFPTIENVQTSDTVKAKRSAYKHFLEFLGEDAPLAAATAEKIEKYKQEQFRGGLKKATVRSRLMILSALFDYAVRTKRIPNNPVKEITKIKHTPDPDPDHLTEEEVEKLYELTQEQRSWGSPFACRPSTIL